MARNAGEPETAKWAKSWQARMAGGAVSREDLVAEMRRAASASSSFQEWTLASADAVQVVANEDAQEDSRIFRAEMEAKRRRLDELNRPEEVRKRNGVIIYQ